MRVGGARWGSSRWAAISSSPAPPVRGAASTIAPPRWAAIAPVAAVTELVAEAAAEATLPLLPLSETTLCGGAAEGATDVVLVAPCNTAVNGSAGSSPLVNVGFVVSVATPEKIGNYAIWGKRDERFEYAAGQHPTCITSWITSRWKICQYMCCALVPSSVISAQTASTWSRVVTGQVRVVLDGGLPRPFTGLAAPLSKWATNERSAVSSDALSFSSGSSRCANAAAEARRASVAFPAEDGAPPKTDVN